MGVDADQEKVSEIRRQASSFLVRKGLEEGDRAEGEVKKCLWESHLINVPCPCINNGCNSFTNMLQFAYSDS